MHRWIIVIVFARPLFHADINIIAVLKFALFASHYKFWLQQGCEVTEIDTNLCRERIHSIFDRGTSFGGEKPVIRAKSHKKEQDTESPKHTGEEQSQAEFHGDPLELW